jgi:hypothetical protein
MSDKEANVSKVLQKLADYYKKEFVFDRKGEKFTVAADWGLIRSFVVSGEVDSLDFETDLERAMFRIRYLVASGICSGVELIEKEPFAKVEEILSYLTDDEILAMYQDYLSANIMGFTLDPSQKDS